MANALALEKSPYLIQHAENPVEWLPWGEAAFAKARAEQKPIFLSIGYATCHWCHVMAHESFENLQIAGLLNASFVPVKVDREERPDVDRVYMAYVQALTGHGGWPLSAWLTPELKPFYGGTYFPPEDRAGRAGFGSILRAIAKGWQGERDALVAEAERVIGALRQSAESEAAVRESDRDLADDAGEAFEKCFQHLYESFDPNYGGFGGAPKFPRASNLNFLFRAAVLQGTESEAGREAVHLVTATLQAMARGGIHDHVGGGYHRYSVDETWLVPHFEKMLYDQAQIAVNALEARQATGDERFAWMARDIFGYVLRDLTHPDGGFYSAEDADSATLEGTSNGHGPAAGAPENHHAEGAFYVWTRPEITASLGDRAPFFCDHYGVGDDGNVPSGLDPQGELRGKNILAQRQPLSATARAAGLAPEQANDRLLVALETLRAVRSARPRPLRDEKIITAWNGLMISALAKGQQVLEAGEPDARTTDAAAPSYLDAATKAARFVRRELYDDARGVLFRCWRDGRGVAEGFAEDYACLIQGLLDLYEAGFELEWLEWAERLQQTMDAKFWDDARGGYFNSEAGDRNLVLRLKDDYDGAEPAASSVAAMNLLRLGAITDSGADPRETSAHRGGPVLSWAERGRRCVEAFRTQWHRAPHAMPQMLCALELALEPPPHVILAGNPQGADFRALAAVLHEQLGPRNALLAITSDEEGRRLATRRPWLAGIKPIDSRATAYVCVAFSCQPPVVDADALRRALGRSKK